MADAGRVGIHVVHSGAGRVDPQLDLGIERRLHLPQIIPLGVGDEQRGRLATLLPGRSGRGGRKQVGVAEYEDVGVRGMAG